MVREVLQDCCAEFDFTAAFRNTFSHFERSKPCQFALLFQKKLSRAGNDLCTLVDRARRPGDKRLIRCGQSRHHFLIGVFCESFEYFASGRVYAAVWHGQILCGSRNCRPPHRASRLVVVISDLAQAGHSSTGELPDPSNTSTLDKITYSSYPGRERQPRALHFHRQCGALDEQQPACLGPCPQGYQKHVMANRLLRFIP